MFHPPFSSLSIVGFKKMVARKEEHWLRDWLTSSLQQNDSLKRPSFVFIIKLTFISFLANVPILYSLGFQGV